MSYAMQLLRTGKLKQKFGGHSSPAPIHFRHLGIHLVLKDGHILCKCNAQMLPLVDGIDYDILTQPEREYIQTEVREYLIKNDKYIIQKIQEIKESCKSK